MQDRSIEAIEGGRIAVDETRRYRWFNYRVGQHSGDAAGLGDGLVGCRPLPEPAQDDEEHNQGERAGRDEHDDWSDPERRVVPDTGHVGAGPLLDPGLVLCQGGPLRSRHQYGGPGAQNWRFPAQVSPVLLLVERMPMLSVPAALISSRRTSKDPLGG